MHLTQHVDANAPLCSLIRALASRPGFVDTYLPQVQVLSWDHYVASSPQIYEPSLIIIAQGSKLARLGPRTLEYGAGHYLIQALSVPFMCETFATPQAPMLGVAVSIDRTVLSELVQNMALPPDPAVQAQTPQSMSSAALGAPMRASVERLLECLQDPLDAKMLGAARVREVLYTALRGPQAGVLRALVEQQGHFARIGVALAYLRDHFAEPLSVEALASRANMSVSTFHEHFKRCTELAPMQYLKRLRLLKAQQMLIGESLGVAQVAHRVGYQSTSQFSREYKREFARSPGDELPYRSLPV
ncbi:MULTISPECIES: AraC family transcriptional regulator [Pseudomonas]|uniref:AraC family transcriptional regulator n=2 Tax=Pseudomonas TaxID=286 RepID=A0AAD0PF34_PSEPU|nr:MULTISPECIES: AraC family transcriptional regulator [Pseudomonas]ANC03612.1 AraC family transcriptional regulator [Pseudomonas putida]AXA25340.1 AraC family transcriptional regulator [Pseudomonas putida]KAB5625709.1 AraC family transcriptional regulator [Pseudomonas putida]MBH3460090.1 AraC family transcriptional regulator [Pseudomonas putida]MBK0061945.1 AraC family transcriptional regulator [Pseudomonas sp. S44]